MCAIDFLPVTFLRARGGSFSLSNRCGDYSFLILNNFNYKQSANMKFILHIHTTRLG